MHYSYNPDKKKYLYDVIFLQVTREQLNPVHRQMSQNLQRGVGHL